MNARKILALTALAVAPALVAEAGLAATTRHKVRHAGTRARGIDVSEWDGTVDWPRVKKSGIRFAIARVSDGLHHPDATFHRNWAAIGKEGLVRGVYQFFRPGQDGVAQARLLLSKVRIGAGDLPPILDVEVTDGASSTRIATEIDRWVGEIKKQTGLEPMIYTAPGFWDGLGHTAAVGKVDLWVADWGVSNPAVPRGFHDWMIWQTSSKGRVPGISGDVDMSVFHGTVADLHAYVGISAAKKATTTTTPVTTKGPVTTTTKPTAKKKLTATPIKSPLPKWLAPIVERACIHDGLPKSWVASHGLYEILSHESSFNPHAQNPSSTAYGLFQFLDSTWSTVGGHKTGDAYLQCVDGLRYLRQRYGNPERAWSFWQAHHWY